MKSIVQKADQFVSAEFNNAFSDKYIDYGVFIPKKIDFTSRYFEGLNDPYTERIFNEIKRIILERLSLEQHLFGSQRVVLNKLVVDIRASKNLDELINVLNSFYNNESAILPKLNSAILKILMTYKAIDKSFHYIPKFNTKDPNDIVTSELGILFLDRSRLRPNGFAIGEHVTSVSLGPGDEVTLEQKSSFKETRSVEDLIEREFEITLENNSEDSFKDGFSNQNTAAGSSSGTASAQGGASGSFADLGVPVNANAGVSGSTTTQQSITDANNISSELSRTVSQKISSKLRKNHKTTITETSESILEVNAKRVIKNTNKGTSVTYNFFKVMQKYEAQIERKGIRMCWAPFVKSPGKYILDRMRLAEYIVYYLAGRGMKMPPMPLPPVPELVPVIKSGAPVKYSFYGLPVDDAIEVTARIDPADIVVDGTVRLTSGKMPDNASFDTAPDLTSTDGSDTTPVPRKISEGDAYVEYAMPVYINSNGRDFGDVWFKLELTVIPSNKNFEDEFAAYKTELQAYYSGVAAMVNEMREEVKGEAHEAGEKVIERADMKSELLHAVINQYILPTYRDEAIEVELWQRIIDFENIGYALYPNWWNKGGAPVPELPDTNFLNASWGRVFLPIRPGYEEYAVALIFGDKGKQYLAANNFIKEFKKEQEQFTDGNGNPSTKPVKDPWIITVPTDGTHIETIQGATYSLDTYSEDELKLNAQRAQAEIDNIKSDIALKGLIAPPFPVQVNID